MAVIIFYNIYSSQAEEILANYPEFQAFEDKKKQRDIYEDYMDEIRSKEKVIPSLNF